MNKETNKQKIGNSKEKVEVVPATSAQSGQWLPAETGAAVPTTAQLWPCSSSSGSACGALPGLALLQVSLLHACVQLI